jgi:hypothetical protein
LDRRVTDRHQPEIRIFHQEFHGLRALQLYVYEREIRALLFSIENRLAMPIRPVQAIQIEPLHNPNGRLIHLQIHMPQDLSGLHFRQESPCAPVYKE